MSALETFLIISLILVIPTTLIYLIAYLFE